MNPSARPGDRPGRAGPLHRTPFMRANSKLTADVAAVLTAPRFS